MSQDSVTIIQVALPFKERLKLAFETGCILGVKYGLVVLIILGSLVLVGKDYFQTREYARNGQATFEYVQKVIQEQQKQAQKPPAATTESK